MSYDHWKTTDRSFEEDDYRDTSQSSTTKCHSNFMNEKYIFRGGTRLPAGGKAPVVLEAGDYNFKVLEADEPYSKVTGDRAKWVLKTRLLIQNGPTLWYRPWSWAIVKEGERDAIGDFLLGIGRAPKAGQPVQWDKLVGSYGRCRLRIVSYLGEDQNEIHWIYVPKPLAEAPAKVAQPAPEEDPDDLPF